MKARLWDEERLVPAVAVGIDDIVGTGIYSGEYLVASKNSSAMWIPASAWAGAGVPAPADCAIPLAGFSILQQPDILITDSPAGPISAFFHGDKSACSAARYGIPRSTVCR